MLNTTYLQPRTELGTCTVILRVLCSIVFGFYDSLITLKLAGKVYAGHYSRYTVTHNLSVEDSVFPYDAMHTHLSVIGIRHNAIHCYAEI